MTIPGHAASRPPADRNIWHRQATWHKHAHRLGAVIDIDNPGEGVLQFLGERHLATLTTMRADGSPHVVAVGFTYSGAERLVRVITFAPSVKAQNAATGGRAAVCQIDGGRWLTLEGTIRLVTEPAGVAAAVEGYAARYRQPGERADRVAIEIKVDRILGRA